MQIVRIAGGGKLAGRVAISGAKNAGLPLLAACLLTTDEVTLRRMPELNDIRFMAEILEYLGCDMTRTDDRITVRARSLNQDPSYELVRQMRASICLMGALVARNGQVKMPLPGGCVIGQRPIDLHLRGLQKLGCEITIEGGLVCVSARQLRGARIFLGGRYGSTVTGTANVLSAAVLARGTTIIQSAACEPEVVDLCHLLTAMGAKINGIGSPTLEIEGVDSLHGADHAIIPDRIEFGTFLLLALITGSCLRLPRDVAPLAGAVIDSLEQAGAIFEVDGEDFVVRGDRSELRPMELTTLPFPGFPTDLQAPMSVLMTQIPGVSLITERIYPNRFMHINELCRMGADITMEGATSIIKGRRALSGAPVMASDLRCGAALYLAGLAASGETTVQRIYHVDRGYDHFEEKLAKIGARIQRQRADEVETL